MSEEPSGAMIEAGIAQAEAYCWEDVGGDDIRGIYSAMRAAAPTPPSDAVSNDVVERVAVLDGIAVMMSEFVENWPEPKRIETALELVAKGVPSAAICERLGISRSRLCEIKNYAKRPREKVMQQLDFGEERPE